ncbi:MAG: hypothetical protein ACRC16_26545 [Aeromonas salmonicida]
MFICQHCNGERKSRKSLLAHEVTCPNNPSRKISRGMKGKVAWNKGLSKEVDPRVGHSESTKEKIRQSTATRIWPGHSEEFKKAQSERAKKLGLGGVRQSRWIKYKGKTLGSSYELSLVKSLEENGVKWDTCCRFDYIDPLGKKRTYTPDLFLEEYGVYLDPKNDFLINNVNPRLGFKDTEKIKCVEKQNSIRVIVLNKDQLTWDSVKLLL